MVTCLESRQMLSLGQDEFPGGWGKPIFFEVTPV